MYDSVGILMAFILHQNMDIAELIMIYRRNKAIFSVINFNGTNNQVQKNGEIGLFSDPFTVA